MAATCRRKACTNSIAVVTDGLIHVRKGNAMANNTLDLNVLNSLPEDKRVLVHQALKDTLTSQLAHLNTSAAAAGCEHTRESGPLHGSQHQKCSSSLLENAL